jgi:hypothetical protein
MKNKKTLLLIPFATLALAACAQTTSSVKADDYAIKWITPTSTPALAFYDQGKNENWVSSSTPGAVVPPAFGTATYDAIVFDGVSGLNLVKKNNWGWKMAKWISGGNFYVVSTLHTAKTDFAAGQTITGFVETGNAAQTFLKLSKEKWNWTYDDSQVLFLDGVDKVSSTLLSNPDSRDYWIVADPIYTNVKAALAKNGKTLNVISDLQADWKAAYNAGTIPAAALFVRSTSYDAHKEVFDKFLAETQTRVDASIDKVADVAKVVADYGTDDEAKARFGFTSSIVTAMQGNGANKFAMIKSGEVTSVKAFANGFASIILGSTFADSYFLS